MDGGKNVNVSSLARQTSDVKECTKCGELKQKTEFSKKASKSDGLKASCKACDRAYHAAHYAANRNAIKANVARYQSENIDKRNAYLAKYCSSNRDRIKAKKAKHYLDNRKKISAGRSAYYFANAEKIKARCAEYRAANPEKLRIHGHNRRARERESGGRLSPDISLRLFKLQRGKCACGCKRPLGDDYHLDHRMPLALGGSNTDDNMQLLRKQCNLQKSAKHPVDFAQQRGLLL